MTAPPDRLVAALADRYRIERELGAGGMATVYLAQDLKHDRKVALKVLKPELAAVLGAERFVQEIKTTAALSHPHILPLFDSGESDGFLFYVMPFVDGETLRTKLDRETQLGVDEAVKIATEVADALDYAHQHGVIHRDIKPENILLQGGRPMVADFGIALAVSAAAGGRMTETGLSLGTPHYMSPEQATAEKEISARSDVYSLASVLYEMLAGQPPHTGASAQQIIMKIITEQATPVTALRKSVPPNVAAAVAKALEKLPADRFHSAKEFAEALTNPSYAHATASVRGTAPSGRRHVVAWAAGTLALVALAGGYVAGRSAGADADQEPVHFLVNLPDSLIGVARCCGQSIALTPDGQTLVFVGRTAPTTGMLYRLDMDQLQPRAIPGTEQGASPFISPDGEWLGFEAEGTIKKVRLTGGSLETIVVVGAAISSATWTDRDRIVYAVTARNNQLWTVGATGDAPAMVLAPDSTPLTRLPYPFALPGGRVVLSSTEGGAGTLADRRIVAVHLETGRVDTIGVGTHAKYAKGQLFITGADGTLSVQSFDPAKLRTSGARTTILQNLARLGPWMFAFTVSDGGSLAYELASDGDPFGSGLYTRLMVADVDAVSDARPGRPARAAAPVPLPDPKPAAVFEPAISPDGYRMVYRVPFMNATNQGEARGDLYLFDLRTGVASRFTTRGATGAVWSRDGRSIAYNAIRSEGAPSGIYRRTVDHSSEPELIVAGRQHLPSSWAPDGRLLLTSIEVAPATSSIGYVAPGDTVPRPILRPGVAASLPVVSQDGRWLAYELDRQIWMQPMEGPGVPIQVSAGLGEQPRWSRAGRTLYYIALPERTLVAATFTGASVSSRTTVSSQIAAIGTTQGAVNWDIFPDGKRVIFTEPVLGGVDLRLAVVRQWPTFVRAMGENR